MKFAGLEKIDDYKVSEQIEPNDSKEECARRMNEFDHSSKSMEPEHLDTLYT